MAYTPGFTSLNTTFPSSTVCIPATYDLPACSRSAALANPTGSPDVASTTTPDTVPDVGWAAPTKGNTNTSNKPMYLTPLILHKALFICLFLNLNSTCFSFGRKDCAFIAIYCRW